MGRTILFIFLVAFGFVIVYLILKKKIDTRTDPSAVLGEVREEVNRIIVELNQTTDRNITLIEDKLKSLAQHLAVADKKISLLSKESEKNEVSTQVYTSILKKRVEEQPDKTDDAHEQVLRLHHSGVSPAMIAKRLGKPLAEIDLIISLSALRR